MKTFSGKKCIYCNKFLRARKKVHKDFLDRKMHVKCFKESKKDKKVKNYLDNYF